MLFFWFSVIKCKPEDVTPPDHASVQCTHPYGNFSYDSQCEYSCEEGYELKGSSTTRCTSTTEWSSQPPTCERELNLHCKIKMTHLIWCFLNTLTSFCSCSMSRADRTTERPMQCQHPIGIFSYQSTCEFMCEEGYTLRDSSSSTLFCGETGRWNDTQPTCESKKSQDFLKKTLLKAVQQQFCSLLFNILALGVWWWSPFSDFQ